MNSIPDKDQLKELARLKNISRQRLRIVTITAGLILLLSVSFFLVSGKLKNYCEDFCYYILHHEAENIKKDINRHIAFFREDMDVLANLLEEEEDLGSRDVQNILRAYESKEIISQMGILFPDNQVMLSGGTYMASPDEISFDQLMEQAPFFSDIIQDARNPDRRILYYAIPIEQDFEIRGILFGVINMDSLSEDFEVSMFGGEIAISIVDSDNMDEILADFHGHQDHEGSGHVRDFSRDRTGSILFPEPGVYSLCESMDISGWSLLLSVPKRVVLDTARYIETFLFGLGVFQTIAFLTYFIWTFWRTKKETKFKEAEMRHIYYMYNVQQILFDAYRQPESIILSLEQIARTAGARGGLLVAVEGDSVSRFYSWQDGQEEGDEKKQKKLLAQSLAADMLIRQMGYTVSVGDASQAADDALKKILDTFSISRLTATPIGGQDRRIVGVLAVIDGDKTYDALDALVSVAFSYSMALDNIRAYETIEKMGTTDALTGLKNRNFYENVLKNYEENRPDFLTCVYADANGLHELNNSQGHGAGDNMLKSVAAALAEAFEDGYVFRIGGDEFLVFTDMDEASAAGLAAEAKERVRKQGYQVSIGTASGDSQVSAGAVVKTAEQRMYEDKRQYYLGTNDRRKMR